MADMVIPDWHLSSAALHSPPLVQVQTWGRLLDVMAPELVCFLTTSLYVYDISSIVSLIESTKKEKKGLDFHFAV